MRDGEHMIAVPCGLLKHRRTQNARASLMTAVGCPQASRCATTHCYTYKAGAAAVESGRDVPCIRKLTE